MAPLPRPKVLSSWEKYHESKLPYKQTPGKVSSRVNSVRQTITEPEREEGDSFRENSITTVPRVSLCSGNNFSFRCETISLKVQTSIFYIEWISSLLQLGFYF